MIGVFDSGLGGLTVVRRIFEVLPDYRVTYFGDTARVPYGGKSAETVTRYALEDADLLLGQGAKLIVVACNTASAVALDALRERFEAPVVGVIEPAVRAAVAASESGRIGVIGTRATIASGIYERMVTEMRSDAVVIAEPAPLLVPLVEEDWLDQLETPSILRTYLTPLLERRVDTIILACTHYPILRDMIARLVGDGVTLVDPAQETAAETAALIARDEALRELLERSQDHLFLVSDITPHFAAVSERFLGRSIEGHIRKIELP
ncbi:MAG: glutamate racemase [Armatimonadota bacterium]|nr:MAG: glutamate racemase [Armatimonadota bacterium]